MYVYHFFFFKQKTAYEMRISDWSQTCALPIYYEAKLRKKIRTSGCAVGTVFGDLMEKIDGVVLPETEVRTSWLYALSKRINTTPSLYLEAGAIHGCVPCPGDRPLVSMEDGDRKRLVEGKSWSVRVDNDVR